VGTISTVSSDTGADAATARAAAERLVAVTAELSGLVARFRTGTTAGRP
jgi:methyl-accepting chemotaxis protein